MKTRSKIVLGLILIALGIAAVLMARPVKADGAYLELGLALANSDWDCPEYCSKASNPLGTIEYGYEKDRLTVYFQHTSSIHVVEEGHGHNTIGVRFKVWKSGDIEVLSD